MEDKGPTPDPDLEIEDGQQTKEMVEGPRQSLRRLRVAGLVRRLTASEGSTPTKK